MALATVVLAAWLGMVGYSSSCHRPPALRFGGMANQKPSDSQTNARHARLCVVVMTPRIAELPPWAQSSGPIRPISDIRVTGSEYMDVTT